MCCRLTTVLALVAAITAVAAQQPQSSSLKQAENIINGAKLPASGGLQVQYLEEQVVNLEGKKASGRLGEIGGGTKFFVEFKSGGVVLMGTAEEGTTFKGTWSQSGNTITMKAGASTFSGTLERNRLSGTRSRTNARTLKDTVDTWELTLEK
jgi:hypothetical protein